MWNSIKAAWNGTDGSEETGSVPVYNFDQMKQIVGQHDPTVVLVDVREPSEYSVVRIPGSINIPYRTHPDAFTLNDAEFQSSFGVPKPAHNKELIFFCASGMRASKAEQVASKNGYNNTSIYKGSMNDWVAHGGDKLNL
ncbi:hypothetical protein NCAS_0B00610 [Naumovozyma castellii]|uniref:Rhodanese domain-containing protein n=1 Tax=Naumovozyma castellii TaxID=27288 RepID=G0VB22_NAUCA|nr:hypothetical protein NCAS_0B00610 [Naumovozyma castellii CBS 4309]CCC68145.1 hypothetical protein NCAS_0B00610 [Naumovozyma castellii CBS 4309]